MICRTMLQIKPVLKTLPTAHSQQITTAITANNHLGKQSPKKGFVFFCYVIWQYIQRRQNTAKI